MKCNRDCFNCQYSDCVVDSITADELRASNKRDKKAMYSEKKQHELDMHRIRNKRWYEKNKEARRQKCKEYYHSHKEEAHNYYRKRRELLS